MQAALGLWAPGVLLLWRRGADNARKQPEEASGTGPQSLQGGVGPAQGIFSRVLGRLLAPSRPPGSPSISPTEWRGWVGGVDLFPGFGTSHPPCPPPSSWPENNGASPDRPSWDSRCGSRVGGHWPHSSQPEAAGQWEPRLFSLLPNSSRRGTC